MTWGLIAQKIQLHLLRHVDPDLLFPYLILFHSTIVLLSVLVVHNLFLRSCTELNHNNHKARRAPFMLLQASVSYTETFEVVSAHRQHKRDREWSTEEQDMKFQRASRGCTACYTQAHQHAHTCCKPCTPPCAPGPPHLLSLALQDKGAPGPSGAGGRRAVVRGPLGARLIPRHTTGHAHTKLWSAAYKLALL